MEYKHKLPSLEELRSVVSALPKERVKHSQTLSGREKFALFIHKQVGSLGFFFLIMVWTLVWLGWNIFVPMEMRFDPAPAFVIWLLASNILQLILLPVIMVGQNVEGRAAEWRAQKDFEVNKKSEHEIGVIIAHLENQNELLLELIHKIDRK